MNKIRPGTGRGDNQAAAVFGGLSDWPGRKGLSEEVTSEVRSRHGGINHHFC